MVDPEVYTDEKIQGLKSRSDGILVKETVRTYYGDANELYKKKVYLIFST